MGRKLNQYFSQWLDRCKHLKRQGVVSIWLLLMLVIMVSGFMMLYKGLLGVYKLNQQLRDADSASRLVLSYYDANLYESYSLLAYENQESVYNKVNEVISSKDFKYSPIKPAVDISNLQNQMVELGETIIAEKVLENVKEKATTGETNTQPAIGHQESIPEEATEGEEPTERQKSIWKSLKRFSSGGKDKTVSGLKEEIPVAVFNNVYAFNAGKAASLDPVKRYAVIVYINEMFTSKFHPAKAGQSQALKSSEIEYILGGSRTEMENGLYLHLRIAASRLPMNMAAIISSKDRKMAASMMAATVVAVFPMTVLGAEAAVIGLWATIETEVEVQKLYRGNIIPLIKTPGGTWYTDIESILSYSEDTTAVVAGGDLEASKPGWINYDDQLNIFLLLQDDATTLLRALKLIDINSKIAGRPLNWDHLYTAIEIQIDENLKIEKGYLSDH